MKRCNEEPIDSTKQKTCQQVKTDDGITLKIGDSPECDFDMAEIKILRENCEHWNVPRVPVDFLRLILGVKNIFAGAKIVHFN